MKRSCSICGMMFDLEKLKEAQYRNNNWVYCEDCMKSVKGLK